MFAFTCIYLLFRSYVRIMIDICFYTFLLSPLLWLTSLFLLPSSIEKTSLTPPIIPSFKMNWEWLWSWIR